MAASMSLALVLRLLPASFLLGDVLLIGTEVERIIDVDGCGYCCGYGSVVALVLLDESLRLEYWRGGDRSRTSLPLTFPWTWTGTPGGCGTMPPAAFEFLELEFRLDPDVHVDSVDDLRTAPRCGSGGGRFHRLLMIVFVS